MQHLSNVYRCCPLPNLHQTIKLHSVQCVKVAVQQCRWVLNYNTIRYDTFIDIWQPKKLIHIHKIHLRYIVITNKTMISNMHLIAPSHSCISKSSECLLCYCSQSAKFRGMVLHIQQHLGTSTGILQDILL